MYKFEREDAIRFASEMGFKTHIKGNELIFSKCPYCGNASNKKDKFSINLITGLHHCFRSSCGISGNMITLAQDFNFSLGRDVDIYNDIGIRKHYKIFKKPEKEIEPRDAAIEFMKSRGISEKTCKKYQITADESGEKIIFPFFDEKGQIQFIKYRNPAPAEGQAKEWAERDCKPILFGMMQCDPEVKTLIVTEGQIDSLSVSEAGYKNVVSVPTGAKGFTWVPYCWDWMSQFEKIIIFGDYENDTITLYDSFVTRWKNKVWYVRPENYLDCKDANDILRKYGIEQIRKCINEAERTPVKKALQLADVVESNPYDLEKLSTGIWKLDKVLRGGLPFGQVVLVTGKAGDGKSTFAGQLLLSALENDYKCCAYSGELTSMMFKSWLNFQAAGRSNIQSEYSKWTTSGTAPRVTYDAINRINAWYRDRIWIYDNSISSSDDEEDISLVDFFEEMILQYGVRVLLIDNLMTALDIMNINIPDKYEAQSRCMKKFARLALKYNVLVILIAHMKKDGNAATNDRISGSADISNLASIVLSYERKKNDNDYGDNDRCLKLSKNRLFGELKNDGIRVTYDPISKRIYETMEELNRDYSWDLPFGDDDEPEAEQMELNL